MDGPTTLGRIAVLLLEARLSLAEAGLLVVDRRLYERVVEIIWLSRLSSLIVVVGSSQYDCMLLYYCLYDLVIVDCCLLSVVSVFFMCLCLVLSLSVS